VFTKSEVGTDNSETASDAIHSAAELADKLGPEVHLVTVIPNRAGARCTLGSVPTSASMVASCSVLMVNTQ
jgi:nucleotide-binding universal stress UspA family protein